MHPLLDKYLCDKYPKIFSQRNDSLKTTCMCRGLEIGDGWFFLIDNLCNKVQARIDSRNDLFDKKDKDAIRLGKIKQVIFTQVKEKFSGLRIYYDGGDAYIQGLIDLSEDLSYSICEICGSSDKTVGRNKTGWWKTTCKIHTKDNENFQNNLKDFPELIEIFKKIENETR